MSYLAFISYSHVDERWARWLHRALETYRVPRRLEGRLTANGSVPRRLHPIFRDRDELPSTADLPAAIQAALGKARHLIVLISPAAAASQWVNEEIRQFRSLGGDARIHCLILPDAPATAHSIRALLPPAMGAEGDRPALEPLAADLRPGHDSRAEARLKLVAGLLGLPLDELRQRELHRQRRRWIALTAVSLSVTLLTSALAIVAVRAREAAEREARRAQAVERFVIELFESSGVERGPQARQITAEELLARGRESLQQSLREEPPTRSRLLTTIGRMYLGLDMADVAITSFEEALDLQKDDARAATPIRVELARALTWTAQNDAALAAVRQALEDLRHDATADPRLPIDALLVLGEAAYRGLSYDDPTAVQAFTEALGRIERVAPGGKRHAEALIGLARVADGAGDFAESVRRYREALALGGAGDARVPPHILAGARQQLGDTLRKMGDVTAAERELRLAVTELVAALGDQHPAVADARRELAVLLMYSGETRQALELLRAVAATLDAGAGLDTTFQGLLVQLDLGNALYQAGAWPESDAVYERVIRVVETREGATQFWVAALGRQIAVLLEQRRMAEARAEIDRLMPRMQALRGETAATQQLRLLDARWWLDTGDPVRAKALTATVLASEAAQTRHFLRITARMIDAEAQLRLGDAQAAAAGLQVLLDEIAASDQPQQLVIEARRIGERLGEALCLAGDRAAGLERLQDAIRWHQSQGGDGSGWVRRAEERRRACEAPSTPT